MSKSYTVGYMPKPSYSGTKYEELKDVLKESGIISENTPDNAIPTVIKDAVESIDPNNIRGNTEVLGIKGKLLTSLDDFNINDYTFIDCLDFDYIFYASNGIDAYASYTTSTKTGLYHINLTNRVITKIYDTGYKWMYFFESSKGYIYITPYQQPPYPMLMVEGTNVTKVHELRYVYCFYEDHSGNVFNYADDTWLTIEAPFGVLDGAVFTEFSYQTNYSRKYNPSPSTWFEVGDDIYGKGGYGYQYIDVANKILYYDHVGNSGCRLYVTARNQVYFSYNGLYIVNKNTKELISSDTNIAGVYNTKNNESYFYDTCNYSSSSATKTGLWYIHEDNTIEHIYGEPNKYGVDGFIEDPILGLITGKNRYLVINHNKVITNNDSVSFTSTISDEIDTVYGYTPNPSSTASITILRPNGTTTKLYPGKWKIHKTRSNKLYVIDPETQRSDGSRAGIYKLYAGEQKQMLDPNSRNTYYSWDEFYETTSEEVYIGSKVLSYIAHIKNDVLTIIKVPTSNFLWFKEVDGCVIASNNEVITNDTTIIKLVGTEAFEISGK